MRKKKVLHQQYERLSRKIVGNIDDLNIQADMISFLRLIYAQAKICLRKQKRIQVKNLIQIIKNFILNIHFKEAGKKMVMENPSCEEMMSLFLSIYIDLLFLPSSKESVSAVCCKIATFLKIVLGKSVESIIDVLLLLRHPPQHKIWDFFIPLLEFSVLEKSNECTPELYMKKIILIKSWLKCCSSDNKNAVKKLGVKLSPPGDIIQWLLCNNLHHLATICKETSVPLTKLLLSKKFGPEDYKKMHKDLKLTSKYNYLLRVPKRPNDGNVPIPESSVEFFVDTVPDENTLTLLNKSRTKPKKKRTVMLNQSEMSSPTTKTNSEEIAEVLVGDETSPAIIQTDNELEFTNSSRKRKSRVVSEDPVKSYKNDEKNVSRKLRNCNKTSIETDLEINPRILRRSPKKMLLESSKSKEVTKDNGIDENCSTGDIEMLDPLEVKNNRSTRDFTRNKLEDNSSCTGINKSEMLENDGEINKKSSKKKRSREIPEESFNTLLEDEIFEKNMNENGSSDDEVEVLSNSVVNSKKSTKSPQKKLQEESSDEYTDVSRKISPKVAYKSAKKISKSSKSPTGNNYPKRILHSKETVNYADISEVVQDANGKILNDDSNEEMDIDASHTLIRNKVENKTPLQTPNHLVGNARKSKHSSQVMFSTLSLRKRYNLRPRSKNKRKSL